MSILSEIKTHLGTGALVSFQPIMSRQPITRGVFLSAELNSFVNGPWQDELTEEVFGRLAADLESFVTGQPVTVAKTPRRAKSAFLARLEGEAGRFWEIRQRKPSPSIRIFGGFASKDCFVGLNWEMRTKLGEYGSPEWRSAIENCKKKWRDLFLTWPPTGNEESTADEYLSNFLLV